MRREDSLEKTLMLGKREGTRRRGRERTRWWDSVLEATNMSLTKLREAVEDSGRQWCLACSGPGGHKEADTTKRLNNEYQDVEKWKQNVENMESTRRSRTNNNDYYGLQLEVGIRSL
ncbi:Hypothetical predicted protein [Podarcis lilfordi]|uniref:Uncharacterized protein n=1 Tax=Podarcis lilfordi TaxID=74358 RepID=A0AA35PFX2_9SAUR|nr:Hypothetical predicted protein [Podarcis lilfordi]